jgi:hypothetical protein
MKKGLAIALFLLAAACGGEQQASKLSRQPVSVRGWIEDVETPTSGTGDFKTVETEAARRLAMFQQTSAWIEGAPYASGGVSEAGSFVLLDVPPGNVTISFNAPGAETAQLVLQNLPPNADVLIPGLVLKAGGSSLAQPDKVMVRVPSAANASKPTGATATIAGRPIPIMEVPLRELENRRDYPPPGGVQAAPVATVK